MSSRRILDLTWDELVTFLDDLGEPSYRANQIWHAVFRDLASSYDAISTLPQPLRARLSQDLPWTHLRPIDTRTSADGQTVKVVFELEDGETIETVVMRYAQRATACVSTQAGCAMACRFCATGRTGFRRHLQSGEIVAQVVAAARRLRDVESHLTNLVYMGMGEPLDNYDATLRSIHILNDDRGLAIGARSFTVSTVGIVPGIRRLAHEPIQLTLAVSLHTVDDALRDNLVPVNRRYPVDDVLQACREYVRATHRRITFEVALIAGVNDGDADAREMAARLRGILCHVNLIPFNPIPDAHWAPSPDDRAKAFAGLLQSNGIPASIRRSRGVEIQAGCGQLRRQATDGGATR